ncbi:MAG: hypothetical protein AAB512_03775 [Patescibacteria group bacterium]
MEILKRVFIFFGLFVLFVASYMLITAGSKYGSDATGSGGILTYLGFKKTVPPAPAVRNINNLESLPGEIEKNGQVQEKPPEGTYSPEPSPQGSPSMTYSYPGPDVTSTGTFSPIPTPTPTPSSGYYVRQAPIDTF